MVSTCFSPLIRSSSGSLTYEPPSRLAHKGATRPTLSRYRGYPAGLGDPPSTSAGRVLTVQFLRLLLTRDELTEPETYSQRIAFNARLSQYPSYDRRATLGVIPALGLCLAGPTLRCLLGCDAGSCMGSPSPATSVRVNFLLLTFRLGMPRPYLGMAAHRGRSCATAETQPP